MSRQLGPDSGLRLPPQADNTPLMVEVDFTIATGPHVLSAAVVRAFANGHPIGSAAVAGWTRLRCSIPEGVIAPGEAVELRFEHPCFVRMQDINLGRDDRLLGLCFYAVRVSALDDGCAATLRTETARGEGGQGGHTVALPVAEPDKAVIYRFGAGDPNRVQLGEGWMHDANGDASRPTVASPR